MVTHETPPKGYHVSTENEIDLPKARQDSSIDTAFSGHFANLKLYWQLISLFRTV
jgi:hypothetical protein